MVDVVVCGDASAEVESEIQADSIAVSITHQTGYSIVKHESLNIHFRIYTHYYE